MNSLERLRDIRALDYFLYHTGNETMPARKAPIRLSIEVDENTGRIRMYESRLPQRTKGKY